MVSDSLAPLGSIDGRNSTRRTVATTHTQSTTALRNCIEVSVHRLASFVMSDHFRHFSGTFESPHKLSSTNDLDGPTTGDKAVHRERNGEAWIMGTGLNTRVT
ncbi:hypothetical protein AVEN_96184-1 [Araneus ventricosus]|uniref:Uncharacterized protein n=1 Tax=Araneus ventricosus TaxID=182803 RepID=A0A4Y2FT46_ARAVE|nr:hypothetical protein AVEN_96184-1 [Araneus ventricosus]